MNSKPDKFLFFWKNAENWLIVLFLATFTFNIRMVFLTSYSYPKGMFNEYLTPNVSWANVLMLSVIIIYTIKFLVRQFSFVNFTQSLFYVVIRFLSSLGKRNTHLLHSPSNVSRETLLALFFLIWAGISIFWSPYKPIAAFRFLFLLELVIFAVIAGKSLWHPNWRGKAFIAIIANALFQSILGILQFAKNGSVGIHWLGESIIGPNVDGVAKIIIEGNKHIRAYGTMPHPNILSGFLIIPIFIIFTECLNRFTLKILYGHKVSRGTFFDKVPTWFLIATFTIIFVGFMLTFSRSAFLGFAMGFLFFIITSSALLLKKSRLAIATSFLLVFFSLLYAANYNKDIISIFSANSLEERYLYQNVARETIASHPMIGVGLGQFVFDEIKSNPKFEGWQYQPVHNIYLLVFSELGIVGFIIFMFLLIELIGRERQSNGGTNVFLTPPLFCCVVLSYAVIGLFDHYFWDIQIGTVIFLIPILLQISENYRVVKNSSQASSATLKLGSKDK